MSVDATRIATLRKDGRVDLRFWPSMATYATVGKACALFLQTFSSRDTLLVSDNAPCVSEYNWEGHKLKVWPVAAANFVTSSGGDIAFMHRTRNETMVFSYRNNAWATSVQCPKPRRSLIGLSHDRKQLYFTNAKATTMFTVDAKNGKTTQQLELSPSLKAPCSATPLHGEKALVISESRFDGSKFACAIIDLHRRQTSLFYLSTPMQCFFPLNLRVCAGVLPCGRVQLAYLNVAVPIALKALTNRVDIKPKTIKLLIEFLKPSAIAFF